MPVKFRRISDLTQPVRLPISMIAMVILLALTLFGPAMTMLGDTEGGGSGNLSRQAGYAVVFGLSIVAARPIRHPERLAVVPWPLWLALAWCWLSLAWSLDPSVAIRRLMLTTIIIWSVFAIIKQIGIERTLLFVRLALIFLLILNFLIVLTLPSIGLHDAKSDDPLLVGKWRGIMGHKNQAGLLCALNILFFTFDRRKIPNFIVGIVILLSMIFLWFSASKTSLGLVFVAAGFGFLIGKFKSKKRQPDPPGQNVMILINICVAILLVPIIHFGVQSDLFLDYIADPSGLTGRTEIWTALMRYYLNNPVFSAGYGSFWNISNASPILTYGKTWVLNVSEGHNGYLDLLVTIGIPGLVLVIIATLLIPTQRLIFSRLITPYTSALVGALLCFCFTHNFTESSLFDRDSIGEVFLMIALGILWTGEYQGHASRTPENDISPNKLGQKSRRKAQVHVNNRLSSMKSGSRRR